MFPLKPYRSLLMSCSRRKGPSCSYPFLTEWRSEGGREGGREAAMGRERERERDRLCPQKGLPLLREDPTTKGGFGLAA